MMLYALFLAALSCASSPVVEGILRPHGYLPRLVVQPDHAAREGLVQEDLDSFCLDTRSSWGRSAALPAVDGSAGSLPSNFETLFLSIAHHSDIDCDVYEHLSACKAGMEREGRLCKLQGLIFQRLTISGKVREQLLRVSNLESAEEEIFTTSFMGNVSMGTITEAKARELCAGAPTYSDVPLVILSRDHSNLFHTFGSQLLPLYTALVRFDLQNVKFKTVFMHDWPSVHGGYESRFLGVYEAVSGGVRPQTLGQLPDVVCAETAVVGVEPKYLFPIAYDSRLDYTSDTLRWAPVTFSGFKEWILKAYGLVQPEPRGELGLVLIVTRTAGHTRQMQGSEALAEHARQKGWGVQMMDISTLSVREQIELVMTASIFISVHGAALTLAAFLPVSAVAVELMPVGFGTTQNLDFYYGYSNWLDVASVSHVVWHDEFVQRAVGETEADWKSVCGKQAHVLLDDAAVVGIFTAAEQLWHTHSRDRERGKVWYLNEPVECALGKT